jgi:hypothetical protein
VDGVAAFICFAFFKVHRFVTNGAAWYPNLVGHKRLLGEAFTLTVESNWVCAVLLMVSVFRREVDDGEIQNICACRKIRAPAQLSFVSARK